MGHGDGGIGLLQHQGHRLAHQHTAADHHGPGTTQGHLGLGQQGHHAGGGAAAGAGITAHQAAEVEGMETVGVLVGIEGQQQRAAVELGWQGQLHQDSVDGGISVEPPDFGFEVGLGRGGGVVTAKAGNADAGTGLFLVGHVHGTGGVITDPQHRQTRGAAGLGQAGGNRCGQAGFVAGRQGAAIEALGCHHRCGS